MRNGFLLPAWAIVLLVGFARGEDAAKEKRILVHGHRGSRGTHPENTIPAFEEAVQAGAEVLELDLQLTRDGVPVVWHDAEIQPSICTHPTRKTAVAIATLKLSELSQFDCGSVPQPRFPEQTRVKDLHIVSLNQFLDWAKAAATKVEFNIETKMTATKSSHIPDPEKFAKVILKIIRKYRIKERVIIQSFDFRTLEAIKKLDPKIRTSALFEEKADFCKVASKIRAEYISPNFDLFDSATVKECHTIGIQVAPWTLNTPELWERAVQLGVDAIITDYPLKLRQFLSSRT